jgi:hypothetical protein
VDVVDLPGRDWLVVCDDLLDVAHRVGTAHGPAMLP